MAYVTVPWMSFRAYIPFPHFIALIDLRRANAIETVLALFNWN
jgi:hypothetical protein